MREDGGQRAEDDGQEDCCSPAHSPAQEEEDLYRSTKF